MKIYLCFLFILCTIGCAKTYPSKTPNGYTITKKAKFKLKDKFLLGDTSFLSTNSIYKLSCDNNRWMKFYPDGRVVNSEVSINSYRIADTVSVAGYYTIKNNIIKIEISDVAYSGIIYGNEWYILQLKGKISGDTLILSKGNWLDKKFDARAYIDLKKSNGDKCYFIRSTGPFSFNTPDW